MSIPESNSIACSLLIDLKGCKEIQKVKNGIQYEVDFTNDPHITFKDSVGNKKEMKFKKNCTITITNEKILYNRDDVVIKLI